jgi:hypothetical protein
MRAGAGDRFKHASHGGGFLREMPRLCPQPHGSFTKPRQYLRSSGPPNNTSTKTSRTPVPTIAHAADQGKHPCAGGAGQAVGAAANIPPHEPMPVNMP